MYRTEEELQAEVRRLGDGIQEALAEVTKLTEAAEGTPDALLIGVVGGLGTAIAILIGEMSLRIENIEALALRASQEIDISEAFEAGREEGYLDGYDEGYFDGANAG